MLGRSARSDLWRTRLLDQVGKAVLKLALDFCRFLQTHGQHRMADTPNSVPRYGISAVEYESDGRRIANVEAHRLSRDNKLSGVGIYPRAAVIQAIEEKRLSLVTLPRAFDGKYTVGAELVVVWVSGETFLKMAGACSQLAADEIDRLPTC